MLGIIISTIVISLVGTLAHFLYDLTGHNKFIGLFTAVNESTWEHIKIALTPIFLCGLYDGFVYGQNPNYFLAKFASLISVIIVMPSIFYGYKALTKKPILFIDILSFYLVIFLSQCLFKFIIDASAIPYIFEYLACAGVFVIFGCYATLTLMPLKVVWFKDPISKKYGFRAHAHDSSSDNKK